MMCDIVFSEGRKCLLVHSPPLPLICGCNGKQHEGNVKSSILAAVHDG